MTPAELAKELKVRSKRWCMTLNNWKTEDVTMLEGYVGNMMTYLIVGKENAPTTGTPHLQVYLELKKKKVGSALKKKLPKGSVLIAAKGTPGENTAYCSKGGDSQVWGTPIVQGARKDLDQMKEMIENGCSEKELADSNFGSYLRYGNAMKRYRQVCISVKRNWMPEIYIYWGVTGSGKTSKIFDDEGWDVWMWNGNHKFYQGYDMQDVAVFDDFYGEISLPFMLKLTDRYPMIVNIKNGECNWQPKKIYFTSNVDPKDWEGWREQPQAVKDAFFRRVNEKGKVVHFGAIQEMMNQ